MPKYGSGTWPAAACAASTVLGTAVASQPSTEKPGAEIASPVACSLHADCNRHPSCIGVTVPACTGAATAREAKRTNRTRGLIRRGLLGLIIIHSKGTIAHGCAGSCG